MGPGAPQLRCPFCHDVLGNVAAAPCERCGASTHLSCLFEHGACPILGCAPRERASAQVVHPQRGEPVDWDDLVRDAAPWLEVGESLAAQGVWTAFPDRLPPGADRALGVSDPYGSSWVGSSSWVASSWAG